MTDKTIVNAEPQMFFTSEDGTRRFVSYGNMLVPSDYENPDWSIEMLQMTDNGPVMQCMWHSLIMPPVRRMWSSFAEHQKAALAASAMRLFEERAVEEYHRLLKLHEERVADQQSKSIG